MKNSIINEIKRLKKEKNAVILAHYYVNGDIQAIADYVGDSYYLAKIAKECTADVLVFCGVSFMGESAKILNPEKTVLMPDATADCAMAHMVAPGKIAELRAKYPDLAVVCYVNSTAELKSESDVCVTSSNAVKIVGELPNKNIFFVPDQNLGRFVASQLPQKNIILNDGCCPIHAGLSENDLRHEKELHPEALVLTHPECCAEVVALSDFVGSTAEIIAFAKHSAATEFIICTEEGVDCKLTADNPDKRFFYPHRRLYCQDMKLCTLEKIAHVLATGENEVKIDEALRQRAAYPLDRMLELAK